MYPFVAGCTFNEVWKNRIKDKFCGVETWFAGLDDLIKMKKAAGRTKDKEDLRILQELKKRKEKSG